MESDGKSTVVNVPDGESAVVGVPDGESVVVTLNFGPVRTKGRPKGQDRFSKFAKKRKLATHTVVGESAVVDSCVLCGVCGDMEVAREFCVNGMIKWVDCDFCKQWFHCSCINFRSAPRQYTYIKDVCNAVNVGV
ncbi:PHD finger protein alfin-like 2b8b8i3.1 recname: full=PHD finger protein alfin-like 2 [Plakobranchus ocellatus]|uniref:PHD-type domain-containing protein n=1 Tax=Plakobranchus ocellatus TaxID=259542 RepID=A0AAV4BNY8_9GAST|nr:PHD finger protein alfin-like 2b8b8i3.1 recname: full=PHD finger protein alfin-like 2 [Plakobranchus ocellatus]